MKYQGNTLRFEFSWLQGDGVQMGAGGPGRCADTARLAAGMIKTDKRKNAGFPVSVRGAPVIDIHLAAGRVVVDDPAMLSVIVDPCARYPAYVIDLPVHACIDISCFRS